MGNVYYDKIESYNSSNEKWQCNLNKIFYTPDLNHILSFGIIGQRILLPFQELSFQFIKRLGLSWLFFKCWHSKQIYPVSVKLWFREMRYSISEVEKGQDYHSISAHLWHVSILTHLIYLRNKQLFLEIRRTLHCLLYVLRVIWNEIS